jgi:isoquinoline 1-oxidoreductase beta subunit
MRIFAKDELGRRPVSRRTLLVGAAAAGGLVVAWGLWPRRYAANLVASPGEEIFNAFLKIAADGRVTVVVPQAEMGQGVWTSLLQALADELGADWRTVAVEPAPLNPLYANDFLVREAVADALPDALDVIGGWVSHEFAVRSLLMVTGGSTSVRGLERPFREAGAGTRGLLCVAASQRWGVDPAACDTADGFVVNGARRLRFGELAAEAAAAVAPAEVVLRAPGNGKISGRSMPRIDLPAKVDGSARFAADVRLPDMIFASVRQGPAGATRLVEANAEAANAVPGVQAVYENPGWVAATATNWWAADRALDLVSPRFETRGRLPDTASIETALMDALDEGPGERFAAAGDLKAAFAGGGLVTARYSVGLAAHAPIEPMCATARVEGDTLELWLPTQAPAIARAAAARAIHFDEDQVTVYPMLLGGSFGAKIETQAAEQAAILAVYAQRPVQLMWSRGEDLRQDRFRPPAIGQLSARLDVRGGIRGWQAKIAAPSSAGELARRLMPGIPHGAGAEAAAVAGAVPPYAIGALAVDHHPADIGIKTGMWRSVAHSYTAFFSESFIDELAGIAKIEPLSFRMGLLGAAPRLARCLATATALGGWQGAQAGSGQGIACHSAFGSHIAMLAQVHVGKAQEIVVDRVVAVVDCGRVINPDIIRQQIEGAILFGMGAAIGGVIGIERGLSNVNNFDGLRLPRLADCPEITVEIVSSQEAPGGVGELGVPPVAPALANAVFSATGRRLRTLPLVIGGV